MGIEAGIGPIAEFLFKKLGDWSRRDEQTSRRHHAALKEFVLTPTLAALDEFYVPTCELKHGPITRGSRTSYRRQHSASDSSIERVEFRLEIRRPDGLENVAGTRGMTAKALRSDAQESHWPDLLRRFDAFARDFDAAAEGFLAYGERLRQRLLSELKMAPLAQSHVPAEPWASYEQLSIFILERQLAVKRNELRITNHGNSDPKSLRVSGYDADLIQPTTMAETQRVLEVVNVLLKEPIVLEAPQAEFERLAPIAGSLRSDFHAATLEDRLAGGCPFVR